MHPEGSSMKPEEEDVLDVAAPTQRRPDFCAEALSPPIRIGLLILALFAATLLVILVATMAIWPTGGLLEAHEFAGVMAIGLEVGLTFIVFLVYGALLANNPRLTKGERIWWYVLFTIAGPIALPAYWFKHVWPVPYLPVITEGLAPPRAIPPYRREENRTDVLPSYPPRSPGRGGA